MHPQYIAAGKSLADTIYNFIEAYPEILRLDSPWGLFKIDKSLTARINAEGASLAQAGWALREAKNRYHKLKEE